MVHPDNIVTDELVVTEEVNVDAKPKESVNDVKTKTVAVDVRPQFTNDMTFACREHVLDWVRNEASKLGFDIVILRSYNGTSRRKAFVVLNCDRGGKIDDLWRFSVVCELHNHTLDTKLHEHPIACRLSCEKKDAISELSIIKVSLRNILSDLKRKKPDSVSNIKQVYNERYDLKVEKMGSRSEMQHLLKLLGDNQYVSSFRTCEDKFTVLAQHAIREVDTDIQLSLAIYPKNRKVVKLEYRSPSLDDDEDIQFTQFEVKNDEDLETIF
ncbi:uncharacterized protein LOC131598306 [Vicia villosa]|uniref:uncharacterized protein LOC131598306 n=1 Tax=Vicia villosa TaxID=3911 RepID=UPI00273AFE2F|nr:uncharacterized protein LOC131598306 [Vicia villosa]